MGNLFAHAVHAEKSAHPARYLSDDPAKS